MDFQKIAAHFTPNYSPAPFLIHHAKGSFIYDEEGKAYLDFSSGIAVNNLGHCHPRIVDAIKSQSEKLLHCSNLYWNQPAIELAKKLTSTSFADQVLFTNSGAEANEAALKLARKYFYDKGKPRSKFMAFGRGFHGRTFGALSATSNKSYRTPFEPVVPGFEFARFNCTSCLDFITEEFAGVIVEPVQGEGGVFPATLEFMAALRKRCDQVGALLILDCIQVGGYRTDCLYGYETYNIIPDIISLAKAIGGGMPIGCLLTKKEIGDSFQLGSHGTTFGGNPVSCAAANAVLDELLSDEFQKMLRTNQNHLHENLSPLHGHPKIKEIRQKGMMLGIEFQTSDVGPLFDELRRQRILVTRIKPSTLRVLPPLNARNEDFELFFTGLHDALEKVPLPS